MGTASGIIGNIFSEHYSNIIGGKCAIISGCGRYAYQQFIRNFQNALSFCQ